MQKRKRMAAAAVCLAAAASIWLLSGCARKIEPITKSSFMLNTFVTVTLYDTDDPDLLNGSLELCRSYENIFSRTIEGSEIYKLNHRSADEQTVTVSDDVAALLEKGIHYSEVSDGDFDITVEPLSSLWNFSSDEHIVPSDIEIREARDKVNWKNLELAGNTLTFGSPDTAIDLGAIAKGYIADRMKDYLVEKGVKSAVINLGGNVLCIGKRPDGTPFKVGLQKPYADRNETIATLNIDGMSVVSSGVWGELPPYIKSQRRISVSERTHIGNHHLRSVRGWGRPFHDLLFHGTGEGKGPARFHRRRLRRVYHR